MAYQDFIKTNIAPFAASQIGVYDSAGNRVGSIPLGDFKPAYGERLYRFGLISDVHNETNQADENQDDIRNALSFFNEKESVEFTVICGDLTQTSYSSGSLTSEMTLYQANVAAASPNTPVYPTTGNHDCPSSSNVDIDTFKSYAGITNLFTSDATYSYEVTKTHTTSEGTTITDHFLFLGMRRYEFTSNTYLDADITWLGNKLEEYKNDRCFIITHMFFPDASGNFKSIYPSGNWLSGTQLNNLKTLRTNYPRAIWFSGHSHWKWYLQKYEDHANIWPTTNNGRSSAWTVHVPSCASPIDSDGVSSRVSMVGQSEGAIVDVYENYIDIRAIEFKGADDSNYVTRYLPIGQYRLETAPGSASGGEGSEGDGYVYLTSSMVTENPGKRSGVVFSVNDSTHDLTITFSAVSQGILITDGNITTISNVTFYHDGITWSNGTEPTGNALAKIGFYQSDTSYTLVSGSGADVSESAMQVNTSSGFINNGGSVPITLTLSNFRFKIN